MVVEAIILHESTQAQKDKCNMFLLFVNIKHFESLDIFVTAVMPTELRKLLIIMERSFQGIGERNHCF